MARRTYRQHCALARALDLVGERWTLLLVRELLGGPRRYGELAANLPGLGSNLLAARLRELVEAGLVVHDDSIYGLTERGASLEDAVVALARFGAADLGARRDGDHWSATWNPIALKYAFDPARARRTRAVLELRIDASRVQARIRDGRLETSAEPRWKPDAVLTSDGETFLALSTAGLTYEQAEAAGRLAVEGDRRALRAALRAFGSA